MAKRKAEKKMPARNYVRTDSMLLSGRDLSLKRPFQGKEVLHTEISISPGKTSACIDMPDGSQANIDLSVYLPDTFPQFPHLEEGRVWFVRPFNKTASKNQFMILGRTFSKNGRWCYQFTFEPEWTGSRVISTSSSPVRNMDLPSRSHGPVSAPIDMSLPYQKEQKRRYEIDKKCR